MGVQSVRIRGFPIGYHRPQVADHQRTALVPLFKLREDPGTRDSASLGLQETSRHGRSHDEHPVPKTTIPRPKRAENETGFTLAIACIHAGKLASGRRAPLANMSGIVMKFEITPGVCQSVLEAVTARKNDDMPRPRKKIPRIHPAHMIGSPSKVTPNNAAARIITGIWMSPRLVEPRTFDRYTVAFVVGVSRIRFMNPNRLSWIVLIDPNMPTVNIEVAKTPGSRNAV